MLACSSHEIGLNPTTFTMTLPKCWSIAKPLVRWGIAGRIFSHPAFLASRSAECRDGAKRHRTTRCTKSSQWYAITSRRRNRRHAYWRTSLLLYWQKAGQIRETILSRKQRDGLHGSSNIRNSNSNSNRTGIALLQEELGDKYHIVHSMVNLSDWTDSRRPRVFIWCLHKNCGSEEVAFAARSLASDIGCQRRRTQPEAVEQHLYNVGTSEWFSAISEVGNRGKSNSHKLEQKRAWEPEVLRVRELIIQAGRPWAHEHPLAAAKLQGLAGTERQRAVLEAVLLIHCHLNNLDPRDAKQLNLAKRGLKWDISQNVHHSNYGALRHCVCSCLCTGAPLYSFEADRLVHPGEILSSFGWPADVECALMHWRDIQDLAGESQTLQAIGVVTTALLLIYQKACGW